MNVEQRFAIYFQKVRQKLAIRTRIRVVYHIIKYFITPFRKKRIILINTPSHGNLGDHAITIAERKFLQDICGVEDFYELTATDINGHERFFSWQTYILGRGILYKKNHSRQGQLLIIQGGGFMGSLWPEEEERIRRILEAFEGRQIIIFPQTITFDLATDEGKTYFMRSKEVYTRHRNFTVCVREQQSYEFMQEMFPSTRTILVPDIVLSMRWEGTVVPRKGILLCLRSDKERKLKIEDISAIKSMLVNRYPEEDIKNLDTVIDGEVSQKEREGIVNEKLSEFAAAKLVVTDRLHGMIFSAITGTPCISLNNINGKVSAVYEWIKELPYIYFIDEANKLGEILQFLDVNDKYEYKWDEIIEKFEPLYQFIRNSSGI